MSLRSRVRRALKRKEFKPKSNGAPLVRDRDLTKFRPRTDGRSKIKMHHCIADEMPYCKLAQKQAKESHKVWGKCTEKGRITPWADWKQMARDIATREGMPNPDTAYWSKGPRGTFEVTVKLED